MSPFFGFGEVARDLFHVRGDRRPKLITGVLQWLLPHCSLMARLGAPKHQEDGETEIEGELNKTAHQVLLDVPKSRVWEFS